MSERRDEMRIEPLRMRIGICTRVISIALAGVLLICGSGILAQTQPGQQSKPAQAQTPAQSQQAKPTEPANPAQLVTQMPPAEAAKIYKFPPVASKTLANGLRVYVLYSGAMPAVSVHLVLTAAGSLNDPAGKPGVASMAASMLTQGTDKRSAQQIADSIDFVGGSLSANAANDSTAVSATVVKKDFDLGMDLLSDIALHANFRAEELEGSGSNLSRGCRLITTMRTIWRQRYSSEWFSAHIRMDCRMKARRFQQI